MTSKRDEIEDQIQGLIGRANVIDYDFGPGTIEAELLLKRAIQLTMQLDGLGDESDS